MVRRSLACLYCFCVSALIPAPTPLFFIAAQDRRYLGKVRVRVRFSCSMPVIDKGQPSVFLFEMMRGNRLLVAQTKSRSKACGFSLRLCVIDVYCVRGR